MSFPVYSSLSRRVTNKTTVRDEFPVYHHRHLDMSHTNKTMREMIFPSTYYNSFTIPSRRKNNKQITHSQQQYLKIQKTERLVCTLKRGNTIKGTYIQEKQNKKQSLHPEKWVDEGKGWKYHHTWNTERLVPSSWDSNAQGRARPNMDNGTMK